MADKDLYAILGVSRTADAGEIKKAYRKLARELHPDTNPDNPVAEERFKEVSAAFAVLGDEKKKTAYDEFGPDGLREGFDPDAARNYERWASAQGARGAGPGGFHFGNTGGGAGGNFGGFGDLNDILGGLFGGGGGRQRAAPRRKGADHEANATISVRQALDGTELQVQGRGTVKVPAGIGEGQKIRLAGQGGEGMAGRGDLYIVVEIATPPGFERDGDDLTLELPLTVGQAVLGGGVEVITPEGTTVNLKIPAGTQSGTRMRLRGKGMPKKGKTRGDLYVRTQIRVPEGESDELKAAVAALEEFYA